MKLRYRAIGMVALAAVVMTAGVLIQRKRMDHEMVVAATHDEQQSVVTYITDWNALDHIHVWNNELETYTKSNVSVQGNRISIVSNSDYTSGAVTSKQSFEYGVFIVSAKLPTGKGIFPAIWFRTLSGTLYPELDMVEDVGSVPNKLYHSLHYMEDGKDHHYSKTNTGPDYSLDYHIYELDWTPSYIIWKVDGEVINYTDQVIAIPHEPMYMEINTAIGGNWPGKPDHATRFPQVFDIQYVKYYPYKG